MFDPAIGFGGLYGWLGKVFVRDVVAFYAVSWEPSFWEQSAVKIGRSWLLTATLSEMRYSPATEISVSSAARPDRMRTISSSAGRGQTADITSITGRLSAAYTT